MTLSTLARSLSLSRPTLRKRLRAAGIATPGRWHAPWVEPPGLSPAARAYLDGIALRVALPADDPHRLSRQALHLARRYVSGICARCAAPRRHDALTCGGHGKRPARPRSTPTNCGGCGNMRRDVRAVDRLPDGATPPPRCARCRKNA